MMETVPLKFRSHNQNILFGSDAGDFFLAGEPFLERVVTETMKDTDIDFLEGAGLRIDPDSFSETSYLRRLGARHTVRKMMNYVILVPTLRCDLACSYCQVSRAAIGAKGFDWTGFAARTLGRILC